MVLRLLRVSTVNYTERLHSSRRISQAEMSTDNDISEAMRELRRALGLTQTGLAKAIGITGTSVYRYEAGSQPDPFALLVMARFAESKGLTALRNTFIKALGPVAHLFDVGGLSLAKDIEIKAASRAAEEIQRIADQLSDDERSQLLAFALFLKKNTDPTKDAVIRFLLDEWRSEAKAKTGIRKSKSETQHPSKKSPKPHQSA